MKASTRARYGLRTMVELAVSSGGGYMSIYEIAKKQQVSANYLHQVFSELQKTGLVKSLKGPHGGYALAKPPASITVGHILNALEGPQSILGDSNCTNVIEIFLKNSLWNPINERIKDIGTSITLLHLVDIYKLNNENALLSYCI